MKAPISGIAGSFISENNLVNSPKLGVGKKDPPRGGPLAMVVPFLVASFATG
jgi:hypothetical protein